MGKLGLNDLSADVAMLICNKFRIEKSIHKIDKSTVSVPINIEFDPKVDELIVIKNSIVLSPSQYRLSENGAYISPTETRAWEASKVYTIEFNFIVLKSVLPHISASLWRNSYTINTPSKGVPVTVQGFDGNTDSILVVKNGTVLAHDEYTIKDGILYPGDDPDAVWEATKKVPVMFDFIVFKHSNMQKGVINVFHLRDGSVTMAALHPDIQNTLNQVSFMANKLNFVLDAIDKYGNYELRTYLSENMADSQESVKRMIEEATVKYNKALEHYNDIGTKIDVKHQEVLKKLDMLGMLKDLSNTANFDDKTELRTKLEALDLLKKEKDMDYWRMSADRTKIIQTRRDGLGYHNYNATTGEYINSTT